MVSLFYDWEAIMPNAVAIASTSASSYTVRISRSTRSCSIRAKNGQTSRYPSFCKYSPIAHIIASASP
uniref:hypothetical protein n=1 Tax=Candidatus Wunengus californicus TaxID=3367619 RepID=UPI004028CBD6